MAWTASEPLNQLLLVDAPALVLSPDGAHMLWANPSGAARLGAGNLESLLREEFPESLPLRRQISHLFRWLRGEREQVQRLRLGRSAATPLDMVRVRKLRNLDGVSGVLLQPVASGPGASTRVNADTLTNWLASGHHYAALLSADGDVISSSGAFHDLRKAAGDLQALLDTAYDSPVPVSRHLNVEAGVRHLVTAFKMPFGTADAFLLLVDAEEVSLRRNIGSMPMSGNHIHVPEPANDTEPASLQPIAPEEDVIEPVEEKTSPPKTEVTLEDLQLAIENAVGSKVDIDREHQRAEPPKAIIAATKQATTADVMRFVWRMDESFKFTFVSPEFQVLVGLRGAFEGRSWQDIAGDYQLDPEKTVQAVISSKDMWGGQRIVWALPKRKARAEIELSAMPVFDDERKFQGYRGFGSCRLEKDAEIQKPQKVAQTELAQDVPEDTQSLDANGAPETAEQSAVVDKPAEELPAIIDTRPLVQTESLRGLSVDERKAFEEIGRALGTKEPDQEPATAAVAQEPEQVTTEPGSSGSDHVVDEPDTLTETEVTAHQELVDVSEPIEKNFPRLVPDASAEAELRAILDQLSIGVLVVREDRLLYANKHLAQLAGYKDTKSYLSAKASAAMGGFALDPVKNSDGVMRFTGMNNVTHRVRATIGKIDWMGKPASLLVVDPVPEKADASAVHASDQAPDTGSEAWNAEELLAILNTATEGVLMINAHGKVLALNHGAEALFGESQEVLKGRELTDLLAPESHKVCHDYLQSILGAGVASVLNDGRDVIGRTTQGGYMPLFMTMGRVGDQPTDKDTADFRLCVVLRDITQWKRAEDDLIAARHNAEKANTAKSDFLAKISHEIRTPLNAILGFSEVIMEERFGPIGNPRYKDYISDIHTSGAHVINLVNDMLDISKIEAGQLDLSFTAVDLGDVLKECVALMQPQANEARVIIRTSLADDLPRVVADAKTIRQIALNLLSNSIKFTAEGGQVIVSAVLEKDGDLVLRVRDTGIGMNDVDIATAMEPFRQVDSASAPSPRGQNTRTSGGTGLGLPLTKALVEANRAEFAIESTPAKGTLIRVIFPNTRVLAE